MRRLRRVGFTLPFLLALSLLHFPCSSTAARVRTLFKPPPERQVTIIGANLPANIQAGLQEVFGVQPNQISDGGTNLSDESTAENVDPADAGDNGQSEPPEVVGPLPIEDQGAAGEGQPGEQGLDTDVFLDVGGGTEQDEQGSITVEPSAEADLNESGTPEEGEFPILVVVGGSIEGSSPDSSRNSQEESDDSISGSSASQGTGVGSNPNLEGTQTGFGASGPLIQASISPTAPRVEGNLETGSSVTLGSPSGLLLPSPSASVSPAPIFLQSSSISPPPAAATANNGVAEESPMPTSDAQLDDVWVEIPFAISDTTTNEFSDELDNSIKTRGAEISGTSRDTWVLIGISNGTVATRATSDPGTWLAIYHARFPGEGVTEGVALLVENVSDGSFDKYLRAVTGDTSVTVRMAAAPILDVMPGTELEDTTKGESTTLESSEAESDEGKVEKSNERGVPTEEANRRFAVILGTAFGGIALFVVALVGFAHYKRRTKPLGHTLDGIPGVPTTISSMDSSYAGSSRFETGAPPHPRGAHALRDQSRILDWRLDHVEATGAAPHESGRTRRDTIESPELGMVRDDAFGNSGETSSSEAVK